MSESSLSQVLSSLERLQKEVASIKGDVNVIKGKSSKHLLEPLAQVRSTDTSRQLQESDNDKLTQELVGKTSAETEDTSDGARLAQVLPATEEHLVSTFMS